MNIYNRLEFSPQKCDNNQNKTIEIELSKNGENLYIFFGGIAAGITMPRFEFYKYSKIFDQNKIFIRDLSQCWYQDGLPGISGDIYSTAIYIGNLVRQIKAQKIFFVGNSMGGYAAILFSKLIGEGEVIAFSPQTFISPILRLRYKDFRWKNQVYTTYIRSLLKRKIWNLKPLLLSGKNQKISIFISTIDRLDMVHASHVSNIPGVNIYKFESGGHEVVKFLRDEGKLPAIMSGA